MAMKIPVISTNTGGLPELNVNGVTGYMSNVGDVDDMAKNAISILSDDKKLAAFKAAAHERAAQFDIGKILSQYENLYTGLLEKNRSETYAH
jgi:glycosyltransferase involved in cell wall biosynthesis